MVFYILLIAALNLGLGFGVAVYLSRQHGAANDMGDPWGSLSVPEQSIDDMLASDENLAAAVSFLSAPPPERASAEAASATGTDEEFNASEAPAGPPTSAAGANEASESASGQQAEQAEPSEQAEQAEPAEPSEPAESSPSPPPDDVAEAPPGEARGTRSEGTDAKPESGEPPGDASTVSSEGPESQAELRQWWKNETDQTQRASAIMIDLDQAAQLKQQHGRGVAEKIFRAVAQLLKSENRDEGSFFQISEHRFILLLPETDARVTANTAERLRQTVEKAHLREGESEIQVTVGCAVVGSATEETVDGMIALAEATLQEAKRYGSNRTFLHDGRYPTPVVPPSFSLDERQITL